MDTISNVFSSYLIPNSDSNIKQILRNKIFQKKQFLGDKIRQNYDMTEFFRHQENNLLT